VDQHHRGTAGEHLGHPPSFGGVAALLGMLNSCASNVTVVNIDNGFGAACVASCINRL
jgi:NCAIR mutase (PurE)-related protein